MEEAKLADDDDDDEDEDDLDSSGAGAAYPPPAHFKHRQDALSASDINSIVRKAQGHDLFRSLFAGDETQEATVRSFLQKVQSDPATASWSLRFNRSPS